MACCLKLGFCTGALKGGCDMALIEMFFTQTAVITPFIREADAQPVYGEPETRKCRIQRTRHLKHVYVDPDGELDEVTANGKMFCCGNPIPPRSLVDMGDEHYIVIHCDVMNGFADHHLEVTLE